MVRLGQPKSKTEFSVFFFGFFFWPFTRWQRRIRLLSRLNLLGVTQSVFFMVPEQTQTSTSSTAAAGITSGTECAGGDGPSSVVLGSAGQESTDSNTVSVVSTRAAEGREGKGTGASEGREGKGSSR